MMTSEEMKQYLVERNVHSNPKWAKVLNRILEDENYVLATRLIESKKLGFRDGLAVAFTGSEALRDRLIEHGVTIEHYFKAVTGIKVRFDVKFTPFTKPKVLVSHTIGAKGSPACPSCRSDTNVLRITYGLILPDEDLEEAVGEMLKNGLVWSGDIVRPEKWICTACDVRFRYES